MSPQHCSIDAMERIARFAVMHSRVSRNLLEDAKQEAYVGILQAALRYDSRRAEFKTYAEYRARGRVIDFLRSEDPIARDWRSAVRRGEATAPIMVGVQVLQAHPVFGCQEQQIERTELRGMVRSALTTLEQRVIEGMFFEEREADEVGRQIGVNLKMVFTLRKRALTKLRTAMSPPLRKAA